MFEAIFSATFLICLIFLWFRGRGTTKLPAGPWLKLPIVGHILFIGSQPHRTFLDWSRFYGPVFSVKLGSFPTVVINDGKLLKEAFSSNALAGKPKIKIFDDWTRRKGIAFADGPEAQDQRRYALKAFKNLDRPGETLEARILEETKLLLRRIERTTENPTNVRHFFNAHILSSLLFLLTGMRAEAGDPEIERLKHAVTGAAQNSGLLAVLGLYVPSLCLWFPNLVGYSLWLKSGEMCRQILRPIFERHRASFVPGRLRDIMDHYVEKVITADESSSFYDIRNVEESFRDFLAAGIDTTANQLEWIVFFMAKYPEVQERLLLEIDTKLENGRSPTLNDRSEMLYTEAVVQESLRLGTIIPFDFHSALEDFRLGDYLIPRGTMTIGNLYAANRDPQVWTDPDQFKPERWLTDGSSDEERVMLAKRRQIFAFGTGKRSCIGEGMARSQLFLFTTRMFQHFQVRAASELLDEHNYSVTVAPLPFKVIFSPRCRTHSV